MKKVGFNEIDRNFEVRHVGDILLDDHGQLTINPETPEDAALLDYVLQSRIPVVSEKGDVTFVEPKVDPERWLGLLQDEYHSYALMASEVEEIK